MVLFLIKGLSMSVIEFGNRSSSKLWDKKNENREIFFLYNFLELGKLKFIDIFRNKYEGAPSEIRTGSPSLEIMNNVLGNNCLEFSNYINDNKNNRGRIWNHFIYRGIRFDLNYKDISPSNDIFDLRCAKAYLLNIYNYISLSDEIFSPLTINDVRLVNFVWSYIRVAIGYRNNTRLSINHIDMGDGTIREREHQYIYNNLNLIQSPSDTKIKIEQIKVFFGLLGMEKNNKEIEVKYIYKRWGYIKNDLRIIDWLDNIEKGKSRLSDENKKEMIDWIWRHIKTKYYSETTPAWGDIDNKSSINQMQQQKENIITFFDLMTNEAIKSSIISELKTSTSKAKYKILNNKKTHLNTPISEKTKSKFDALKKHFNFSNEEMIISLIDDRYEKIKMHGTNIEN